MPAKNTISEQAWDEQAALYELGFKHGNQIARELGVSPQTVSRQMKRRGAVKGSRVNETMQDLEAALDRKARCAALMELSDSERRRRVVEANLEAVGQMVAALLEADRQGDLTLAAPAIDRMASTLGQKRKRRR
jgi:IS30 family transposase